MYSDAPAECPNRISTEHSQTFQLQMEGRKDVLHRYLEGGFKSAVSKAMSEAAEAEDRDTTLLQTHTPSLAFWHLPSKMS